jgi:hypothetical protein
LAFIHAYRGQGGSGLSPHVGAPFADADAGADAAFADAPGDTGADAEADAAADAAADADAAAGADADAAAGADAEAAAGADAVAVSVAGADAEATAPVDAADAGELVAPWSFEHPAAQAITIPNPIQVSVRFMRCNDSNAAGRATVPNSTATTHCG